MRRRDPRGPSRRGARVADTSAEVPVFDAPGRDWRYSGGGYTLAQLAVERATGKAYSRVVERQVLRPLAMARTGFECSRSESAPRGAASGHDAAGNPMPRFGYAEQAAAGVCSTAGGMGRFAAALMRGPIATAMAPRTSHGREVWPRAGNRTPARRDAAAVARRLQPRLAGTSRGLPGPRPGARDAHQRRQRPTP